MSDWAVHVSYLLAALFLVVLNGFFVAAEFALVKVRGSQLDELVRSRRNFAKTAKWLSQRLDASLSACQLGITMASLGLGWVGEPAFAHLLEPVFRLAGIRSAAALHTVSFIVAFTAITMLHLVIGEQAPKIFAIRRPEKMILWCAAPLKLFYILAYPFLQCLNWTTAKVLRWVGIEGASEHDAPHTELELRGLLRESHGVGHLTKSEHRLLNAVFEFDDLICRRVMVPRSDLAFVDLNRPMAEAFQMVQRTKHTRYPVCDGSLDKIVGVLHIKDLIGISPDDDVDLQSLLRPPKHVPETMLISKLLHHFQATHQLMAFVVDEHGTLVGAVTLENVLEEIVGPVEDEFDSEQPAIVPSGPNEYIVSGSTPLEKVSRRLGVDLINEVDYPRDTEIDTLSGLLVARVGRIVTAGDRVELCKGVVAEVLSDKNSRATSIRLRLTDASAPEAHSH